MNDISSYVGMYWTFSLIKDKQGSELVSIHLVHVSAGDGEGGGDFIVDDCRFIIMRLFITFIWLEHNTTALVF